MTFLIENGFFPPRSHVPLYIWATQLDRICIGYCDPIGNQGHVYVRLIGPPDRAVNLHITKYS